MILTISEAAIQAGVTEGTIRQWVMRGYITPLRRGAKPLRFHEAELSACAAARISKGQHARLDALWDEVLAQG